MSGFKTYIGCKLIQATPSQKITDKGLEDGYAVFYPDGYSSWSPKAVFEEAYREVSAGEAAFFSQPNSPQA